MAGRLKNLFKIADSTSLLVLVYSDILLLLESVLIVPVFLWICPFYLDYLLYWNTIVFFFPYNPSYFWKVGSNFPSFISDFSNFTLFLVSWPSLAKLFVNCINLFKEPNFSFADVLYWFLVIYLFTLQYLSFSSFCLLLFVLFLVS